MLALHALTVTVAGKEVIHSFSYDFEKEKIYGVMGPNGSGKSTLVQTIIGNPSYTISPSSLIEFKKKKIHTLSADKRAKMGIGITFQSPLALQGISVFQLLRLALPHVDVLTLHEDMEKYAKALKIKKELLERPLNEGASGGERKKLEVLQMALLNPTIIFFDEIDTGVDVDSLKTIFSFLKKYKKDKTYVFITHYSKIFSYLKPDEVLILKEGRLVKKGGEEVVKMVEEKGYGAF